MVWSLLKIEVNRKNWVLSKTTQGIDYFPASFTMEHICACYIWDLSSNRVSIMCKCLLLEKIEGLFWWWWNNNNKTNDWKVIRFWSSVSFKLPKILRHMKENRFYAWMYLQNCFGPFHVLCIHLKSSMWSHVKKKIQGSAQQWFIQRIKDIWKTAHDKVGGKTKKNIIYWSYFYSLDDLKKMLTVSRS